MDNRKDTKTITVCQDCHRKRRSWQDCLIPTSDWFSISDIFFCRLQVLWLIEEVLPVDAWPSHPAGTGYTDAPKTSRSPAHRAPFESIEQVKGELYARLARTGTDGKLLVRQVWLDEYLEQEARDALNYVVGWRRKRMGYGAWKRWRDYKASLQKRKLATPS